MRRSLLLIVPSLLILAVFLALLLATPEAGAGRPEPVSFDQGVASGDVTSRSAVLWTRASREAELEVQVSLRQDFKGKKITRDAEATAESDFTVKRVVGGLQPDQTYFYRFKAGRSVSDVGTFRTPPRPGDSADVRFAFSSDADGSDVPPINNFEVLDRAREDDIDFWVFIGDTVYLDTNPPKAETLEEMRAKYQQNRGFEALRDLLAATSTYAIWDDHEVENDFDGATVDPGLLANGLQVFKEYMPIRDQGNILFRSFRWGKDVELIILDERQFRDADVESACEFFPGFTDLAPTLPASIRLLLGLPADPPPGCLEAINNPTRTMLGAEQKEFLKSTLLNSSATWKIVINELAFGELFALPYDRWEGYAAERAEILNFIRDPDENPATDDRIENVVFLTGDLHANILADVRLNAFLAPDPIVKEAIAGPIAQNTVFQGLIDLLGSPEAAIQFTALLTSFTNPDCAQLDAFGYGLVEVDSETKDLRITLKGDDGAVLNDQLSELAGAPVPCTITLQAE